MSIGSAIAKRCVVLACAVIGGAGCDLVARTGETLVLANRGSVFGSGGDAQTAPLPAVNVQPGGNVVVQDADLFGGGILVQQVGQQAFDFAGAGIRSVSGTVRVQQGLVSGGPVVIQVQDLAFDSAEAGIRAVGSSVEVVGGMVQGGAVVSQIGLVSMDAAPAVITQGGTLRVSGGTLNPGALVPALPNSDINFSILTFGTQVEVLGGSFGGGLGLLDGRARVLGGTFPFVFVDTAIGGGCVELRGGQINEFTGRFPGITAINGGRLIVAGTGLSLTPIVSDVGQSQLTGTLESGQPVNVVVFQDDTSSVELVPPGGAGCP